MQFTLHTKFGQLLVKVHGTGHFYVYNDNESGVYNKPRNLITIRGKEHTYVTMHCGVKPDDTIDGQTYDFNGNDCIFVSKYPTNPYFKVKAVWCSTMTDLAKKAFFDEVLEKLNAYYKQNKATIQAEWGEIKKHNHREKIKAIQEKIQEANQELEKLNNELKVLVKDFPENS